MQNETEKKNWNKMIRKKNWNKMIRVLVVGQLQAP